jgi:hypothetical protein
VNIHPYLTPSVANGYAELAVAGLEREYPNAPQLMLGSPADLRTNRDLHPAFYGCFDWHSSVHSHWLLVRLLRTGLLSTSVGNDAIRVLDAHLTTGHLAAELSFFSQAGRSGFEFPYGWAWLLRLWHESGTIDAGRQWRTALSPLADHLGQQFLERVQSLVAPLRSGAHRDLGFSMAIVLDVLGLEGIHGLRDELKGQGQRLYGSDANYPWAFEPSGYDFTSSGLNEVAVMKRVLTRPEFAEWLAKFWPGLSSGDLGPVASPVLSPDILDGQGSHLCGLSLSRAWVLSELANMSTDELARDFTDAAEEHLEIGLSTVHSGGYMGEHWLASFATFALTNANQDVT